MLAMLKEKMLVFLLFMILFLLLLLEELKGWDTVGDVDIDGG